MSSQGSPGGYPKKNREGSGSLGLQDLRLVSATDANRPTSSPNVLRPVRSASSVIANTFEPDIPPDMANLLQKLEEDFMVNKTIDQWTYINRREEIMNMVNRLHRAQHEQNIDELTSAQLERPLYPRKWKEGQFNGESVDLLKILESRATIYKGEQALMVLDARGKEVSGITWDKLYLKAVKIACEITHKLTLKSGELVILLYKDGEVAEFTVALFACFLADVTAIPIHQDISLNEVLEIISLTNSKLLLYSDSVAKELERFNSQNHRIHWPSKLHKWKTTDLGSAKKSELSHWKTKQNNRKLPKANVAYVEFSRSPVGELRGIALAHKTILHQMHCLDTALLSMPEADSQLHRSATTHVRSKKVFLASLDIRFSIGIIMGIFFTVYSGNQLIWAPQKVMEIQGLYAHIISKFRASLLLTDYINLKRVTYDYQKSPNLTRYYSKTQTVDFSSVKWVLVNALTVDGEFMEILTHRYLRPLGCRHPENAIIPMLTLSEYGGMVISLRDWLGGKENLGLPDEDVTDEGSSPGELFSVLIEKEALTRNEVKIVETNPVADEIASDMLRIDSFGFPLPDATLAIVNPELSVLFCKGELGEIWIDSPCLSGGFYGLRKESRLIFHAKCRDADSYLEMDFLRTGLIGFTYKGKVFILGLYEDKIRQKISWLDQQMFAKLNKELIIGNGTRYHYSSHLLATLASEVKQIYDCTIFDIFIGNEYLPIAIVEAEVIRKPIDSSDSSSITGNSNKSAESDIRTSPVPLNEPVLNAIAQRCFDVLYKHHLIRFYCVAVVDCDTLPKIMRSGGREIANMLCKKRFLEGTLKAEYIKFFMGKSISMIPRGEDVIGGIWSPYISELRNTSLMQFQPQYSSVEFRNNCIDDKSGKPISNFKNIMELLRSRVNSNGDAIAFQNFDNSGRSSSKPLTWKKFENRIFAVCHYIIEKSILRPGSYTILMYSLSEEFIIAVYACFFLGIVPIPMLPFDTNRIGEDFPAFVGVIRDFNVQEILVNEEVEKFLKNGIVADSLKKLSSKKIKLKIKNTSKLTKVSNVSSINSRISRFHSSNPRLDINNENRNALIWLNFTSDHYRVGAKLSHKSIMGICKVFKETTNLTSKSTIVGCVRHSSGIGFVQAVLLGVYLGATTYLSSPVSFAENPLSFFLSLARYKVKDVFVTEQMLKYAAVKFNPKGFNLGHLKNMMISTENRVEIDLLMKISRVFQPTKLSAAALSTVYNHCFNPMIATRSYMTVAPVDLYLDAIALRQGYVSVVNQVEVPNALHIQDSGIVPVCTQIAIVNPETRKVCREGEFGEIWVSSEANVTMFTNGPSGPVDKFSESQFLGQIVDGDPNVTYLRTGDLGFLHNISIAKNKKGMQYLPEKSEISSFQPLFVLGKIADTFEIMGLHHFPIDIENTIESCHPDIFNNGSCVFKCGEYTIVVCEAKRTKYFAALVPLIVNTVLSKHHLVIDIVAFIRRGEFPISRLGTKQRARIIDAWVQGVIPIVAQYGVNNGETSMIKLATQIDEVARDNPITGLKNPAQSFYEEENMPLSDDGFITQTLTLNNDPNFINV